MKKLFALCSLLLALGSLPCHAQRSFDLFAAPRTLVITAPQILAAASTVVGPYDTKGFTGTAKITLIGSTNSPTAVAPAGTITALLEGSTDTNTWTAISYGKAISASITYTNTALGYGTNVYFTDTFLLPGTLTTPTAATAGFASTYLAPVALTATAAVSLTTGGIAEVGYNIDDAPRYLRVTWTATGGAITNGIVSAILTGAHAGPVK